MSAAHKTLVASHTCADFCIWLPLCDPPPWLTSGWWCICVTGMGANGTEAKVSWEEGLYTPRGSSSSLAFLIPAASACVLADDYVPTGGPWGLKRLDFGMRLHAVLFGVMLLSLYDVASYFLLSSPKGFSTKNTVLIQMKCQLACVGACWTLRCRSALQLYLKADGPRITTLWNESLTVTMKWSNQPRRDPV